MKKTLFFTLFAFIVLFAGNSYAQMTEFTWSDYHVKFQIPTSFHVDKNTADEFQAGNDDAYLSIYPKTGQSMTLAKMKSALIDWASSSNVSGYDNVNTMDDLNGYWGVYIDGKKSDNNLPASLLLLVHPNYPTTMLYVWINYKSDLLNTAVEVLKSFTPTY